MRNEVRYAAVFALGFSIFTAGCGNDSNKNTAAPAGTGQSAPAAGKTVTYALIPKELNNPVFILAQRGAQKAAKDLEKQNPGTTYNIIYQSSETGKANEEADTIATLAAKRVDGMSVDAIDPNAVKKPIDDAIDAGIPVMTFDSDAPDTKRIAIYSINDEAIGQQVGTQLIAAVGGKDKMVGEVAVLSGHSSALNLQGRVKGVLDVLNTKNCPGIKLLPTLYCDDNVDKSVELVRTTMQAHPKLRAFAIVGGWPLFAKGSLDPVDTNVTKVVAVDSLPQECDYLKTGKVYALLGQKYFGWGEQSVLTLDDYRTGKNKNPAKVLDSGFDLIFLNPTSAQRALAKDNVRVFSLDEYGKQWDDWNKNN